MRTALLSSLSHNLRTPLTAIRGAAERLVSAHDRLAPEARADLLDSIVQDAGRMTRFLASISRMARVETGEIKAKTETVQLADLPQVFDSFFRARQGDRVIPGTSLGLAIARAFAESMGSGIQAVSPRADLPADGLPGTIVTLRLPAA